MEHGSSQGIPVGISPPMSMSTRADPHSAPHNGASDWNDTLNERWPHHPCQGYASDQRGIRRLQSDTTASIVINSDHRNAVLRTGAPAVSGDHVMQPGHFNPFSQGNYLTTPDSCIPAVPPLLGNNLQPSICTPARALRRQNSPTSMHYNSHDFALDRDPFDSSLQELGDGYEPVAGPLLCAHHSSAQVALEIPMLKSPKVGSVVSDTVPKSPIIGQIMVCSNQCLRPYSYVTSIVPYPYIRAHAEGLAAIIRYPKIDMSLFVNILTKRTPGELEALRLEFFRLTHRHLEAVFQNWLKINNERNSVKYALMGLAMGPILFDLWLLQDNNLGYNEEILIDIFVGRHPEDLRLLELKYRQQAYMNERSLTLDASNLTNDPVLREALKICTEISRPDLSFPVDKLLVQSHVHEIIFWMESARTNRTIYRKLFNILLRCNDDHIILIAENYRMKTGMDLDEAFSQNMEFGRMAKKILVHAVRTAKDMTHRDAMLLRDTFDGKPAYGYWGDEKHTIRVVRMHWYRQHWKQIGAAYSTAIGRPLTDQVRGILGFLGELMRVMYKEHV